MKLNIQSIPIIALVSVMWSSCECTFADTACPIYNQSVRFTQEGNDMFFGDAAIYHPESLQLYTSDGKAGVIEFSEEYHSISLTLQSDLSFLLHFPNGDIDTIEILENKESPTCCPSEGGIDVFLYNREILCSSYSECSGEVVIIKK